AGRGCIGGLPRPPRAAQEIGVVALLRGLVRAVQQFAGVQRASAATLSPQSPPGALPVPARVNSIFPNGFVSTTVASGLSLPTDFAFLPDGRILIAEKHGVVRVYKNGSLLTTPFIDISNHVNDYYDRGLLGIAVDPNFASNGFVYLLYTYENDPTQYNGPKTGRLTRVTATGDTAGNETVILGSQVGPGCGGFPVGADCIPSEWYGHSVGALKFAPDGTLFVTLGDAASWNTVNADALRAQNLDSLAGKNLRITTTGAGLSTNPFWNGSASANRSKVWGYGFRNAYRFNIRPGTSTPFIGDVGWNDWEEIDVGLRGANFGWPCYEGTGQQAGYAGQSTCQTLYATGPVQPPLITYPHNGQTSAVTGGAFYTGSLYPAQYQGAYFYGDYGLSTMQYAQLDANNALVSGPTNFATGADGPVAIEMGPDGNLWYIAISAQQLRRIDFTGAPPPPPTSAYVSDMSWISTTNGWGPVERDMSNGDSALGDGRPITLNGTVYPKGLGTNAYSDVQYALAGACTTFTSDVGVDDEVGSNGSVVFQVWTDGTKRYDSGLMTGASATKSVNVGLTGVNTLELVVTDGGNGNAYDHGDWAGAQVLCQSQGSSPPSVTRTSPADQAAGVSQSTSVTATFSQAMDATTITASTFTLTKQGATQPVAATVAYNTTSLTATLQPTSALDAGATYTARVVGGANGVKDANGAAMSADKTWTFSTAQTSGTSGFLSDWTWTSATNGWGPVERDMSNGDSAAGDGKPITLNGSVYAKGLGVNAASDISFTLGGSCSTLKGYVGVDDEVGPAGSVGFQILGDGVVLFDSGLMTGATPSKALTVNVSGRTTLDLVVNDGGDGTVNDHADWADVYVTCSGTANSRPTPSITQPSPTTQYKVGDTITFSGSAVDQQDGAIPSSGLSWQVVIHHCPGGSCHVHFVQQTAGPTGTFVVPDHGDDSYLEFVLSATDSAGAIGTTSVALLPQTVQITLASIPSGLQLNYSGQNVTAPFVRQTIVGSAHTIYAPSPQASATFLSWSDGGAQQHDIVMGTTNATFTATFTSSGGTGTQYLSDMAWTSSTNGWGPVERDMSNGESAAGDGHTITLNGAAYAKGLGTNAISDIRFALGGACSSFSSDIGVDDEVGALGSVVFQVWTDGALRYDSGTMTGSTATKTVSLSIAGVNELRLLVTDAGDGAAYDHGDWADAQIACGSATPTSVTTQTPSPATPTATSATVIPSATPTSAPTASTAPTATATPAG